MSEFFPVNAAEFIEALVLNKSGTVSTSAMDDAESAAVIRITEVSSEIDENGIRHWDFATLTKIYAFLTNA